MRKISDIYQQYKIPLNLQRHMLWVAAVATIICDNFDEPLPKEDIVTACLLHDMGNIIKYELGYFPEFLEPQGLEYWQKVQDEFREKYSRDEHKVTFLITKELGLSDKIIELASGNGFQLLCKCRDAEDILMKMMHYCDNRVGPYGILSYDERMEEARKRYQNREGYIIEDDKRQKLVACGKDIEKQIFAKCKIKPEDINDETVKLIIESLKDFVIK
jgi:hypothetical protein